MTRNLVVTNEQAEIVNDVINNVKCGFAEWSASIQEKYPSDNFYGGNFHFEELMPGRLSKALIDCQRFEPDVLWQLKIDLPELVRIKLKSLLNSHEEIVEKLIEEEVEERSSFTHWFHQKTFWKAEIIAQGTHCQYCNGWCQNRVNVLGVDPTFTPIAEALQFEDITLHLGENANIYRGYKEHQN